MADSIDPYRELGLSPDACTEPELVRAAFKTLAKKYHPDTATDPLLKAKAEEKMRRLNEAQRLILSGEYRPPVATTTALQPVTPPAQPQATKSKPAARPPRRVPIFPVMMAALGLLIAFLAPGYTGRRHYEKAQQLESQGQYQEALEVINQTIAQDARNGKALLLRARLWKQLGYPDRVKTDLSNARMQVSQSDYQQAEKELLPSPSPTPTPRRGSD